uniref:Protein FAM163B n=1 Tax=Ursus maritimus TaxID=29073 RepID=A0A452VEV7_URSMA
MTAGTVVITGGILATVILLCIIAVLCYCRLQYYCCKKDESEEDEEEPDSAVPPPRPPLPCSRNLVLTNGPALYPAASTSFSQKTPQARALCRSCSPHGELPAGSGSPWKPTLQLPPSGWGYDAQWPHQGNVPTPGSWARGTLPPPPSRGQHFLLCSRAPEPPALSGAIVEPPG